MRPASVAALLAVLHGAWAAAGRHHRTVAVDVSAHRATPRVEHLLRLNCSASGTSDCSGAIDAAAARCPAGCTLVFGGPGTYLIEPAGAAQYETPASVTLSFERGAALKTRGTHVTLRGAVVAGGSRIFVSSPQPVGLSMSNVSDPLPVVVATLPRPHGLVVGGRFVITGAAEAPFNGPYGVMAVLSPTSFSFVVGARPAVPKASGAPQLHVCGFRFGRGVVANVDARPMAEQTLSPVPFAYPEWWGAQGMGQFGARADNPPARNASHDDTLAVQHAFDSGAPVLFLRDYAVSRVVLAGAGRMVDGHNHWLAGLFQDVPAGAVLELKCGSSVVQNLWVMADFDRTYASAVHLYTNDLNLWQPEFNRFINLQFWFAKIGLAIGALPTQPHCCAGQGVVAPDGEATNAPLSESSFAGLNFYGVEKAIYFHQPNGYLQVSDSTIATFNTGWPESRLPFFDYNATTALHQVYGSLDLVNCDVENQPSSEGAWKHPGQSVVSIQGGSLSLKNIIYEASSSFRIGGHACPKGDSGCDTVVEVTWDGDLDGGLNGASSALWPMNMFEIAADARGSLTIKNQNFNRGAGYAGEVRNVAHTHARTHA